MFALSDSQLRTIWNAADGLPAGNRGVFLERIVAWLQFRAGRFIDRDLDDACAWHCGGWSTSRRPDLSKDEARRIAANIAPSLSRLRWQHRPFN